MSESEFSQVVTARLIQAGWYPARAINIQRYIEMVEQSYSTLFPAAEKFLSSFGDLVVDYTYEEDIAINGEDKTVEFRMLLYFDKFALEDAISAELAEKYRDQLSAHFCMIGLWSSGNMTILMDQTGKVYGGYGSTLYNIGDTYVQAIENILLKKEPLQRLEPPPLV